MNDRRFVRTARIVGTGIAALALVALVTAWAQTPNQYETALKAAYAKFKDLHEGKNADYIPALAKVDPNLFGIALVTVDRKVYRQATSKAKSRFNPSQRSLRSPRCSRSPVKLLWLTISASIQPDRLSTRLSPSSNTKERK